MTSTPVEVRGLRATYGDFVAVDGIDLRLQQGELFALLGTNGAGKTTTLETLEGHRKAQEGEVRVMGLDPYVHRRRLAGSVATMLQESGFAGELTSAETLRMWQRLHPERRGPADPLAEVDLDHRRDVRVQQLSGGERRRLDLALAISTDPDLLFLDEPTTGLDPESRERTWQVLRELLERGRSILLTTHYLEEAEALADRIAIMHQGRIAVSGTLAEVVGAYDARIRCDLPALPGDLPTPPRALPTPPRDLPALPQSTQPRDLPAQSHHPSAPSRHPSTQLHDPSTRSRGSEADRSALSRGRSVLSRDSSALPIELSDLPHLPAFEGTATLEGRRLTIRTRHLQADLYRLLSWADAENHPLAHLSATEASLAEIFKDVSS